MPRAETIFLLHLLLILIYPLFFINKSYPMNQVPFSLWVQSLQKLHLCLQQQQQKLLKDILHQEQRNVTWIRNLKNQKGKCYHGTILKRRFRDIFYAFGNKTYSKGNCGRKRMMLPQKGWCRNPQEINPVQKEHRVRPNLQMNQLPWETSPGSNASLWALGKSSSGYFILRNHFYSH